MGKRGVREGAVAGEGVRRREGGDLNLEDVKHIMREDVDYMQKRRLWRVVPVEEC